MDRITLEELKKVDLFSNLPNNMLHYFSEHMEFREYKAGEILCNEGDDDPWLYLIQEGLCRAKKKAENGKMKLLRTIKPYELMGLTSVFKQRVRSATLEAYTDLQVWALSYDDFKDILFHDSKSQELILSLLEDFTRRIRQKNKKVVSLLEAKEESTGLSVAVFDSKEYTKEFFEQQNKHDLDIHFFDTRLGANTAALASGFPVVCAFVNDDLSSQVIELLHRGGTQHIAMRCAGFNNVDLETIKKLGMSITRVPAYSPYAVAEHALALIMSLNRKIHHAYNRVREGNFTLEGLVGFDLHGSTVGVIGTGKIGGCLVKILKGMGCKVLVYDKYPNPELQKDNAVTYVDLNTLLKTSDIISLHAPLTKETHHLIDYESISQFKDGAMLINTSRGALINTEALIEGLKSGKIGGAGLDVYEEESKYFFEDFSKKVISDDMLARLLTFNNVIITSHQAFLTKQALVNIADSTLGSISEFQAGKRGDELTNAITF